MALGKYIVLDGMDGSGKDTQIDLLQKIFPVSRAIFTREPGGDIYAEKIRTLVRDDSLAKFAAPLTEFLLFWAARSESQDKLVAPALAGERHVFSNRGDSATYAYQLFGRHQRHLEPLFLQLREEVFGAKGHRCPDLYLIYDLPAEVARARVMRDAERERNHFDNLPLAYYVRVREGFREFSRHYPVRFVDATRPIEEVHAMTIEILQENGVE